MAEQVIVGGESFTLDPKTGYYLSTAPLIGRRRIRLHRWVWRLHNGPIPRGYFVHHIDGNKANNSIDNLTLMAPGEHAMHHAALMTDEHREKLRLNLIEKAVPASRHWHRSKAGRQWHSQHAREALKKRERPIVKCWVCGREFRQRAIGEHKFCSNNCKSAWRRASGVDNVERTCSVCGATFICNKYSKGQTCSRACSTTLRWRHRH